MKQRGNILFGDVADEFDLRLMGALVRHLLEVAGRLGVVGSGNDQLGVRNLADDGREAFDEKLQPLVGAPLSEGEDAMLGIAATREIRVLGASRQSSVAAHIHRPAAVLAAQDVAIGGHHHRNRVGEQQHLGAEKAAQPVHPGKLDAGVLEIDRFHQLMEGDVGVVPGQADSRRDADAHKCGQGLAAEAGKAQIEPHQVGLEASNRPQQAPAVVQAVESPAADDVKALALRLARREVVVPQDGEGNSRNIFEFARDVETVFVQSLAAGRKCGHQADLHYCWPEPKIA